MAGTKREEDFIRLKSQFESFRMKKIEVNMRLEQARKNLDKLEKEAVSVFGTSDIGVIQENLATMQDQFDRDMVAASNSLNSADEALTELDKRLKDLPDIDL